MKKSSMILTLVLSVALAAAGCGSGTKTESQKTETTAVETESWEISESDLAEFEKVFEEMSYDSVQAINDKVGYAILTLPAVWGEPDFQMSIDQVSSVLYTFDEDVMIQINTCEKAEDAKILDTIKTEEKDMSGVLVTMGSNISETGSAYIAAWNDGILYYHVESYGMEEERFLQAVEDLVKVNQSMPGGKAVE